MSEKRKEVYQILELGKHLKNLHHKKGFGGLLFIDLSMIKFSKLSTYIRQLDKENQELKEKIETYEDPEDLTLMFMYCDEKAKEKIRELKKQLEEYKIQYFKDTGIQSDKILELENQQKEFIDYMEEKIICYENHQNTNLGEYERNLYFDIYNDILEKYKEIIGNNE